MTIRTLSAFGWTVIQQKLPPDCPLDHKIEFMTYGWDGSAMIPIDITDADEPDFTAAWNALHLRLRTVLEQEVSEVAP